ncbi:MAG: hypothetical protein RLZZ325_317 [Pseudomonadota bacterium]
MTSLADLVLAFHFGIALFITLGLLLIPLGFIYSWSWIRNRRFRQTHAGLMLFVAIEAVFAITCPLTVLEAQLRQTTAPQSFWAYQLNQLLYWDLPPSFFVGLYLLCSIWVVYLWRRIPPRSLGQ